MLQQFLYRDFRGIYNAFNVCHRNWRIYSGKLFSRLRYLFSLYGFRSPYILSDCGLGTHRSFWDEGNATCINQKGSLFNRLHGYGNLLSNDMFYCDFLHCRIWYNSFTVISLKFNNFFIFKNFFSFCGWIFLWNYWGFYRRLVFVFKALKLNNFYMWGNLVILVQKHCFHKYLLLNNLSFYHNSICWWSYLM